MNPIPFVTLDDPRYGAVVEVAPLVRRVIAENPSKFTYRGTGTYIVGRGEVAVIDPGPLLDSHRDALAGALQGDRVTAILVTHCHSDHSPLAAWLRETTGAPTVAFGPHAQNPDWVDDDEPLVTEALDEVGPDADTDADADGAVAAKVEESIDLAFEPDVRVADGDVAAAGEGYTLRAVHTPGHTSNHLCFWFDEARWLFTGDHIMGWSTSVITPPDGDMRSYFSSLDKVRVLAPGMLLPTHGEPVRDVPPFIDAFVAHRLEREAQVLAAVRGGTSLIPEIVCQLYAGVDEKLHRAAGRSVLAHLMKLTDDGLVRFEGERQGVKAFYLPT